MSRHQASVPLLSILLRLGWLRDSNTSTTRCLPGRRRNSTPEVRPGYGCVTLEAPSIGLVYLSPLRVGRLRAALKDAVLDLDRLSGDDAFEGRSRGIPTPPRETGSPPRRPVLTLHEFRPATAVDVIQRARPDAVQARHRTLSLLNL
jgi:hypothetical protein